MVRLKDVGKIITGNTPKTSEKENYESNDICFVKPSDIESDGISYIEETENFIAECAREKARILPVNSVLVTCIGIIGKIGINKVECAFNQQINAIVPNEEICLAQYLAYAIKSKKFLLQDIANAPVVPILNKTQFADVEIKIVDLKEQESIVHKLAKVEALLEQRKQQLQKLDELVKARFVEMFGDKGNVKVVKKTLGNICEFQQGTQIPVEKQYEEYVCGYERFLRIIDYTQPPQPPRYVSVVGKKVDEKSVVIVRYGATAGFVGRGYCGILANNLFEVIPDERVMSKDFLFLALKYGSFEMLIHDKVFGAAMPALSFSMMNDITIVVPTLTEQEIFTDFAAQIDKSKLSVQRSLEKLETLKKALMQKYFG